MTAMSPLHRWWLRRRHRDSDWAGLLEPYRGGELVSLDLETTGLNNRRDRILALAAVPVCDRRVRLSERFSTLVRPGRSFGIDSIRHHRLRPADLIDAPPLAAVLPEFLRWLGNRPLLGYCIRFDLAMLAEPVRAVTGFALPNASTDLAFAYARRCRRRQPETEPDMRLEAIAASLGVPVLGRHSALGDAVTVALAWLALHGPTVAPVFGAMDKRHSLN